MKLQEMARIVLERTDPSEWRWSITARECNFEEFTSPILRVGGHIIRVKIVAHCWLDRIFPTVKVKVDGRAADTGGQYSGRPWGWESKFLRESLAADRKRHCKARYKLLNEMRSDET